MKTVVFRVDSGDHIGMGHLTRCSTLADELIRLGCRVHLITKKHAGSFWSELGSEFIVHFLPSPVTHNLTDEQKSDYSFWLGTTEQEDLMASNSILNQIGTVDLAVVDHYSLGENYERGLQTKKVMVVDDLCFRKHKCHLLLNQNLGVELSDYTESKAEVYLLGPQYALLRREFGEKHRELAVGYKEKEYKIKKILVFFGFGDVSGNCLKLARFLNEKAYPDFSFTFLLSDGHRDFIELSRLLSLNKIKGQLIPFATNMVDLILKNDFCIGAAGASCWERASLGIPSAVVELAENQAKAYGALIKNEWAFGLGKAEALTSAKWTRLFQEQLKEAKILGEMGQKTFLAVDGLGAQRAAQKIMESIG